MKKNVSQKPAILFLILFCLLMWTIDKRAADAFFPSNNRWTEETRLPFINGPHTFPEKILFTLPISISKLSQQDWELLPNIGPVLADRIIAYQRQNGPIVTLAELDDVPGIGPKTLESLKPFFRGAVSPF